MENYNNIRGSQNRGQTNFNDQEAYFRAKKKLDKLKGFYWHLAAYVVVNLVLLIIILFNLDNDESIWQFGHLSTPFFWGIGLAFHFMGVFAKDLLFGKDWEKRKINEYLDKDREQIERFE